MLVARKSRGSTVGSYIIYSLKLHGKAPKAILLGRSEPIVIAGSVLAGIPLYDSLSQEFFEYVRDGSRIKVRRDGIISLE